MSSSTPDTTRVVVSAPGKIMLAGEYAILEGAPAVTIAVQRRARATLAAEPLAELPPLIAALREEMAESTAFAGIGRAALDAIRRVQVDSSELYAADGSKLGLGSSAATAVAAAACALSADGGEIPRELVQRLAHRAHGNLQERRGARGSGADIAASTYGGVLEVCATEWQQPVEVRPLSWPENAHMVAAWTGQAADTPTLVERVRALRVGDRRSYETAINRIAESAGAVIDALESGDVFALIDAVGSGAEAIAGLGSAAGAPLVIDAHEQLSSLAQACVGAAKPTGAGGGDITLAVFAGEGDAAKFAALARDAGFTVLDELAIADGVIVE